MSAALWREAIELVRSGVATVEDVDKAVRYGPGLRWAVMGPHLIYHLGGGPSGIRGHISHLTGTKEGMLRDLATWTTFPPDTADVLAAGVEAEVRGKTPRGAWRPSETRRWRRSCSRYGPMGHANHEEENSGSMRRMVWTSGSQEWLIREILESQRKRI